MRKRGNLRAKIHTPISLVNQKIRQTLKLRRKKLEESKREIPEYLKKTVEAYRLKIRNLRETAKSKRYYKSKNDYCALELRIPRQDELVLDMGLTSAQLDQLRNWKNSKNLESIETSKNADNLSPERLGLRSKNIVDSEGLKGKGINFSPNFGVTKKRGEIEEELGYSSRTASEKEAPSFRQPFMSEGVDLEIESRAFKSIENMINPGMKQKQHSKATVEKELLNLRKSLDDDDILSGKFLESLKIGCQYYQMRDSSLY